LSETDRSESGLKPETFEIGALICVGSEIFELLPEVGEALICVGWACFGSIELVASSIFVGAGGGGVSIELDDNEFGG
jgi:hypothetical protein